MARTRGSATATRERTDFTDAQLDALEVLGRGSANLAGRNDIDAETVNWRTAESLRAAGLITIREGRRGTRTARLSARGRQALGRLSPGDATTATREEFLLTLTTGQELDDVARDALRANIRRVVADTFSALGQDLRGLEVTPHQFHEAGQLAKGAAR